MDTFVSLLLYMWKVLSTTLVQVIIILGPALALAFAINYVSGFIEQRARDVMGRRWYLGLFGWLGTTVHELGHAIFCPIFGHRIDDIKLFDPDPDDGTLGYVRHSFDPDNLYHRIGLFFIGIGPILLGTALIYLFSYLLLGLDFPSPAEELEIVASGLGSWSAFTEAFEYLWTSCTNILSNAFTWKDLSSWRIYLFIYLVFAIGSSIKLSKADMKGTSEGFALLIAVLLFINLVTLWVENVTAQIIIGISGHFGTFYSVMLLALLFNMAAAVVVLIISRLISRTAQAVDEAYESLRED